MRAYPLLAAAVLVGALGTLVLISGGNMAPRPMPPASQASPGDALTALDSATEWLNSEPLTAASLRGRVVLADVWTYTCINWLRTLPYVRAWAEKYRDQGLVVIGVHAPEFPFERDLNNVRHATAELRVPYPVVIDNDYAIWRAFDNNYWPALYLVDAQGRTRYHHFGEGEYAEAERMIQRLLAEAGAGGASQELVAVAGRGLEAAPDLDSLRSPENYLGYARTENFASPGGTAMDQRRIYAAPARLDLNHWALTGDWTMEQGAVALNEVNGRIVYRFHARDLHLVMGPPPGATVRFRVLVDGQPPGTAHGVDVDDQGYGTLSDPRLYQLIRQAGPIADRQFEIEFLDPGAAAFAFTFG